MAFARPLLRNVPGLRFWKLLGTGAGSSFSSSPDWGRYAMLGVWESEAAARAFLRDSRLMLHYRNRIERSATVILRTLSAHGAWDGSNPFLPVDPVETGAGSMPGMLGVLTRATIRPRHLRAFWRDVPAASRALEKAPGLVASIGVGELPLIRQATFSLWRDTEAMKRYAYGTAEHREVIERTRREGWYSEELFARFAVIDIIGEFP
jgi:heme-degrading monooxygenase HmoA